MAKSNNKSRRKTNWFVLSRAKLPPSDNKYRLPEKGGRFT